MSGRTPFWRRWTLPGVLARPARIIFPLAGSCRPPATHAKRRQDGCPPSVLWLSPIAHESMRQVKKTRGGQAGGRFSEDTMTQRTKPPFRADMVGSLLRTASIKQARAQCEKGTISAAQLKEVEDREIEKIIKKQEEVGLKLATDGEFRRAWWHFDFFRSLKGIEFYFTDKGIKFHGVDTKAESVRTGGKIGFAGHPHIEHFKFLKQHCRVVPKMTIPAPGVLHFRQGRVSVSQQVYPELDAFFDDLGRAYRDAGQAFAAAGCRYLQFDDTTWAMMCEANERAHSRERGDDPDQMPKIYARMINMALEGKPADMVVTMHSCRGNFRSTWIAEGGYEPVAEVMFNDTNLDGYFLEYDSERAGGFAPLRFFPKGKKQ